MTRKDTILIAVVINAGLLAILFTTAVIYDTDKELEQTEFVAPVPDSRPIQSEPSPTLIAAAPTGDEVDNVLKYYSQPASRPVVMENHPVEADAADSMDLHHDTSAEEEEVNQDLDLSGQEYFVEVKVKKGDVLEKIARANKTTVSAIKKANNLQHERLSIGQVLKIPAKQDSFALAKVSSAKKQESAKSEPKKEFEAAEAVYYIIKSGDNPWKIAKQFNVKYEDILRLNHLDEDKARNLKIGDRIRVK